MAKSPVQNEFDDDHDWNSSDKYHYLRLKLAEELLLPKSENGDVRAVQDLLKLVSEALDNGARVNRAVASFLSYALMEIYKGENADQAFGIARKRGGKNTRFTSEKSFAIAFFIEEMQEGTLEVKCQLAADKFHVSYGTANKAWDKNHVEARRIVELNKKYFSR
jgi:hypothetical protein